MNPFTAHNRYWWQPMTETEKLVEALIKMKGENAKSIAAWSIGYIESLERDINDARKALRAEPIKTLNESLKGYYENTKATNRG